MRPPKPIVYFMVDKEQYPNDRWLTVIGVISFGDWSTELAPVFCTSSELQQMMEAMHFLADETYKRTNRATK